MLVRLYQGTARGEIAARMGISPATINRMIREGHERGMIEIRDPSALRRQAARHDAEAAWRAGSGRWLVPSASADPAIVLKAVAGAAAATLLENPPTRHDDHRFGRRCPLRRHRSARAVAQIQCARGAGDQAACRGKFRTDVVNHR